jgi:hypothetical protein
MHSANGIMILLHLTIINIARMITSVRIRWTQRVMQMGELRNTYTIFVGKWKEPLGKFYVDFRIIINWL